jgi:hypothetical protein
LAWFLINLLLLGQCCRSVVAQKTDPFPQLTRGVYLQSGSASNIVLRWRTSTPTPGVVHYGTDPANLTGVATSPGHLKEHVVLLSDLTPNTQYYYSVGTGRQVFQRGAQNWFVTAPETGTVQPIRVWVLGDPGTGSSVAKAVRDAYDRFTGPRRTDLVLTLGDNAYPRGTDSQYQTAFFDIYRDLFKHAVLWPAFGNHDARSAASNPESGVYYSIFTLPRLGQAGGVPSGTQAYYSFDYANAHFICLNSEDSDLSENGPMLRWLTRDLAATRSDWIITYWHHPPYSKGSHDSDDGKDNDERMGLMRQQVVPVLEAGGVDLVLCGHSHLYERSFFLHHHYGRSTVLSPEMILNRGDGRTESGGAYMKARSKGSPGTVYVNAGSSGHATKPKDLHGLNHPVMAVSLNVPGSVVLSIMGTRLDAEFIDDKELRRDWFTISKQAQ